MTDPNSTNEPTLRDVLAAISGLQDVMESRFRDLEDRLISRTELLRADIAGVKAEAAVEQAYGRDTAEAMRRHINDEIAHRRHAA